MRTIPGTQIQNLMHLHMKIQIRNHDLTQNTQTYDAER